MVVPLVFDGLHFESGGHILSTKEHWSYVPGLHQMSNVVTLFVTLLLLALFLPSINAFIPFSSRNIIVPTVKMSASDDMIKNYLGYLQANFDNESIRFVVQGTGAILEASGKFSNLRYSDTPSKGLLATIYTRILLYRYSGTQKVGRLSDVIRRPYR